MKALPMTGWIPASILLTIAMLGCGTQSPVVEDEATETVPGSSETEDRGRFLAEVRQALETQDRRALEALFNWEGIADGDRPVTAGALDDLTRDQATTVELGPLPANLKLERLAGGVRYRPNVEVEGVVRITTVNQIGDGATTIPYGKAGGRYWIAGTIAEKTGYSGPDDVTLQVSVVGLTAPDPVQFEGNCEYVVSGETAQQTVSGSGNLYNAFRGQHFNNCTLKKTSDGGWIEVTVSENGERVFESGRVESNLPVVYRR